jgi:Protein of unknown function (DUF3309)
MLQCRGNLSPTTAIEMAAGDMFWRSAPRSSNQQHVARGSSSPASGSLDRRRAGAKETKMLSTILIVVLILLLIGALPTWGYSSGWGYGPGGLLGTILVIIVILALMGRI